MAGQKFLPHGTAVTVGGSAVGGDVVVSLPSRTKGQAESTDHDSAYDREFLPGLRDGGQITISARRIDGDVGQAALYTNYNADNATVEIVITLPSTATDDSTEVTFTFDAFVTEIDGDEMSAVDEEVAMISATLKLAGAVTKATA